MPGEGERKRHHVPPGVNAIGGSIGGTVEAVLLQPIDTVKTCYQADRGGKLYQGSVTNCARSLYLQGGIARFWNGVIPFATHLTLKYALRMGSNAFYQSLLRDKDGKLSSSGRLTAGAIAGVTEAVCIVTPFEVVKTRTQIQDEGSKGMKKNALRTAIQIVRSEGVLGLWKGVGPTILRNGTNQMCLFWAKNNLDEIYWGVREGDGQKLTPVQSMISGASAATLGPVATGPFDVVKTRLMAQSKAGTSQYRGFFHALVSIPMSEGVLAMWAGLPLRLMRIPLGQGIVWAVRDQVVYAYEELHLGN